MTFNIIPFEVISLDVVEIFHTPAEMITKFDRHLKVTLVTFKHEAPDVTSVNS